MADGDDLDAPTVQRGDGERELDNPDNYDYSSEEDFPDFGHEGPDPNQTGARKHRKNGVWDAAAFANRSYRAKQRDKW